ncbi:MAG TPA: hypothetical protein VF559_05570 [Caulobacteraceae bacterium]
MAKRLRAGWDEYKQNAAPADQAGLEREARMLATLARAGAAVFAMEAAERRAQDAEVKRRARQAAAREQAGDAEADVISGKELRARSERVDAGVDRALAALDAAGFGLEQRDGSALARSLARRGGALDRGREQRAA